MMPVMAPEYVPRLQISDPKNAGASCATNTKDTKPMENSDAVLMRNS